MAVLGIAVFVGYSAAKVGWAERQARSACAEAVVGATIGRVQEHAQRLGLLVWLVPESTHDGRRWPARLLAFEGIPFDRWFCNVEHESGKVVGAWTNFFD